MTRHDPLPDRPGAAVRQHCRGLLGHHYGLLGRCKGVSDIEALRRGINTLALVRGIDYRQANGYVVKQIGYTEFCNLSSSDIGVILEWIDREAPPKDSAIRRLRRKSGNHSLKAGRSTKKNSQTAQKPRRFNLPPPLECNIVFESPDGSIRELSSGPRREPIPPGGNGKVRLVPGRGKYRRSVLKKKG